MYVFCMYAWVCAQIIGYIEHMLFVVFLVKTEPMSSSEIATTTTDRSLENFSGSGKKKNIFTISKCLTHK